MAVDAETPGQNEPTNPLSRLVLWATDIQSDDIGARRRGAQFNRLLLGMSALLIATIALQAISPNESSTLEVFLYLGGVIAMYVCAIFGSRAGYINTSGFLVGTGIVASLLAMVVSRAIPPSAEWFYVVGIYFGAIALQPRYVLVLYAISALALSAPFALDGQPLDEFFRAKQIQLGFATLFIYLQSRWSANAIEKDLAAMERIQQVAQEATLSAEEAEHATRIAIQAKDEALRAKEEAEIANETKSRFLATMSHELRTPLNAIIGYADIICEDLEFEGDALDRDTLAEDANKIKRSGKLLLELINDVLDLSKIEAGKIEIHNEFIEIRPFVESLTQTVASLLKPNDNTLEVLIQTEQKTLYTDRTRLRQILLNLLSNATKFTREGTITLEVTQKKSRDEVEFLVHDTGIGMSEEQLAKIFDAFVQADSTTTREYGGTGLGLTLSKNFAHLLGANLTVESEQGVGSTFGLHIPTRMENATREFSLSARGANPRILLVDDDADLLEYFSRILAQASYDILSVNNGREALELLRDQETQVDAVLLDLKMPHVSGWEVLAEIKSDPLLEATPVIIISGTNEEEKARALGIHDYLIKPIEKTSLLRALRMVLIQGATAGRRGRVLVVDDEADNRHLIERLLDGSKFELSFASDGVEALEQLAREEPDMVLLDLMMPRMDGFEVLERMQLEAQWSDIPVVVVTAKDLTKKEIDLLSKRTEEVLIRSGLTRNQLLEELLFALNRSQR